MKISKKIRIAIQEEYDKWVKVQYAGKDKKERQKLGQFFTPPELTVKMIEKFPSIKHKTILDPTIGGGSLIAGCVIAGADPELCFGIELDPAIAKICKKRLKKLGVPTKNIKIGNALDPEIYKKFKLPENK